MTTKEDQTKDFIDRLAKTLDRIGISQGPGRTYLKYLQGLCGTSGILPSSIMLTDGFDTIEARPAFAYGLPGMYKATYKGKLVVAKALKTTASDDLENIRRRFAREVVGWRWLRHENILPFVGVASAPLPFSMVSGWMENGNIMNYLEVIPDQNPFSLLADATNGLQYLHQHDIVHGDLKGTNILINSKRRACLADFGLAAITEEMSSDGETSGNWAGGNIRWMAPELLDPERYGYVTERARRKLPSKSTDIYALGMTILEVVSGRRPFEHTNPAAAIILKVLGGDRPDRPTEGFSDSLWALLLQTWAEEFETSESPRRPNITEIIERLKDETRNWSPMSGSAESYRVLDESVGSTGDFEGVPHDDGVSDIPNFDLDDILNDINDLVRPVQIDDHSDNRDTSALGEQTSPTMSQIAELREETGRAVCQASSTSLPPGPPPPPPQIMPPRTKERSSAGRAWSRFGKSLMKKLRGGDQGP